MNDPLSTAAKKRTTNGNGMDRQTDEQINRRTDEQINRRTDERTNGRIDKQTNGRTDTLFQTEAR